MPGMYLYTYQYVESVAAAVAGYRWMLLRIFLGGACPLRLGVAMSGGKGGASTFCRFWL